MLRSLFGSGSGSIEELVARKKYGKAAELLGRELAARPQDHRLRSQLADVYAADGKAGVVIRTLGPLADHYVRTGEFVKAMAVLKRMQKVDPGRAEIEKKLARVIRLRGGTADAAEGSSSASPAGERSGSFTSEIYGELGAEELGLVPIAEDSGAAAGIALGPTPATPPFHEASGKLALFGDFTEAELGSVIAGLALRIYEPGDIIVTQGEPGDSLFVLTSGTVKAFLKNAAHRNVLLREMGEGTFFGEVSVLSGRPRTATVTAATPCELLELERKALDSIAERHPNVREVLQAFYEKRAGSAEEMAIRRSHGAR